MRREPDLTVIMSVHNGGAHLAPAIESILNQTYSNFIFVIIDDASTDGSDSKIQDFAELDSRIRYVKNSENRGLGYTLASAVAAATTTWIARMDADDIAEPIRLETQMNHLRANNEIDLLGSWAIDIDENGNAVGERRVPVSGTEIRKLIWTNPFIHSSVVFRRTAVMNVGSYSKALAKRQDYDLWFRCAAAGLGMENLPKYLMRYRFSEEQFRRNDWSVLRTSIEVGWRGCRLVRAAPIAYIGVIAPAVKMLVPVRYRMFMHSILKLFDPRSSSRH